MSQIISTIMNNPLVVEILKPVACVIAVLLVELIKTIAAHVYKKKHGCKLDKKPFEELFAYSAFIIAFGILVVYTYFFDFVDWAKTCETAGLYAATTQLLYVIIKSPGKLVDLIKNTTAVQTLIKKIATKKATPKDVQNVAKELTAVEKFYQAIEE